MGVTQSEKTDPAAPDFRGVKGRSFCHSFERMKTDTAKRKTFDL